ncbi:MAG: hypothetical protein IJC16_00230 [Rikenellaceae bacterium]|nr:hypothetical protein [Rikenellaceae bacterium]
MAYVNTGMQRSLTFTLTKKVNGTTVSTTNYDGRLAFGSYAQISDTELASMDEAQYLARLEAFKAYVEGIEADLDVDQATIAGAQAYRQNLTACPIGQ